MTDAEISQPLKGASEKKAPAFIHKERGLAGRLGISRDNVRALRQQFLTQGTHWDYVHRDVMLTQAGVDLIASKKNLPPSALNAPCAPCAPAPNAANRGLCLPAPFDGKLLVWRTTKNTHIIEAYIPGTDPNVRLNIVRVRVKESANFVPKMEITAAHIQQDYYELTSPLPRSRGRY